MANKVIAFRAPKRLASAIALAASMNNVDRNEELILKLTLAYEPYIRLLEAEVKPKTHQEVIPTHIQENANAVQHA